MSGALSCARSSFDVQVEIGYGGAALRGVRGWCVGGASPPPMRRAGDLGPAGLEPLGEPVVGRWFQRSSCSNRRWWFGVDDQQFDAEHVGRGRCSRSRPTGRCGAGRPPSARPRWTVRQSGRGRQTARATGSRGSGSGGATTSISLATSRKRSPRSARPTTTAGPGAASKTSRTGSSRPPMLSGWISQDGVPAAIDGQTSSMCAPRISSLPGLEMVGVVLHEGGAAGQARRHHLQRAQQHRGLPVAFAAEAVAVGHQPLHGEAGQLAQRRRGPRSSW